MKYEKDRLINCINAPHKPSENLTLFYCDYLMVGVVSNQIIDVNLGK